MKRPHYVILGAGISGLALGWFLKQRHHDNIKLTILEASERTGGWIQTEIKNDFLFEQGPRSFRPHGNGVKSLQLIESLGLQDEVIFADPAARKRYLYTNHHLQKLPTGPFSLLCSALTPKLIHALWNDWCSPKSILCNYDESIYSFAERRFGKNFAELFLDPLVSGIYAGNIKELSIKSCFPWLQHLEQNYRCIWQGALKDKKKANKKYNPCLTPFVESSLYKGIFTLKHGVQSLTNKLSEELKSDLKLNSCAKQLNFNGCVSSIDLKDGTRLIADKLFIAIPPKALETLLPHYPELTRKLQINSSSSLAVINFGYHSPVLKYKGFGHLIPSQEKQKLLGVVWDSSAFPQQNTNPQQTRLTAMIGGAHFPDFTSNNDSTLIEMALKELHEQLKISQTPDYIHIKRAHHAIPQYTVGHQNRLIEIETDLTNMPAKIALLGNGYYGISVNDCIAQALQIALQEISTQDFDAAQIKSF